MNNSTIQNNFNGREASRSQTLKKYQKQKYIFRKVTLNTTGTSNFNLTIILAVKVQFKLSAKKDYYL